ncbi:DUF397 domain-containing protein [Streptomyces sp. NBC_01197]|uniref:DUF397 domain-containing protein n=1 Tax=Streptomyces sp. NBC_01197 TaxID=2903768 RepID=UPI003FA3DD7A
MAAHRREPASPPSELQRRRRQLRRSRRPPRAIHVRDSKAANGPVLTGTPQAWAAFLAERCLGLRRQVPLLPSADRTRRTTPPRAPSHRV